MTTKFGKGVLIGNWKEEETLKTRIGEFDPRNRKQQTLTKSRVIEHDEQLAAKDYASIQQATFPDPKTYPNYHAQAKGGPRQRQLESKLKQEVDREFAIRAREEEIRKNERDLRSAQHDAMAQSGFKVTESRVRESNFETKNADYATEKAITFYSHTLEHSDEFNFSMTTVTNLKAPWSKASATSEDIANGLSKKRETWEHPHPLPNLKELKVLKSLREKILASFPFEEDAPGSKMRGLVRYLLSFDTTATGYIYIEEFANNIADVYNITITKEERGALLRAFDHDRCHGIPPGRMRIRDFMDLIRDTLSPRKQ